MSCSIGRFDAFDKNLVVPLNGRSCSDVSYFEELDEIFISLNMEFFMEKTKYHME